eukprot:gene14792-biopygen3652
MSQCRFGSSRVRIGCLTGVVSTMGKGICDMCDAPRYALRTPHHIGLQLGEYAALDSETLAMNTTTLGKPPPLAFISSRPATLHLALSPPSFHPTSSDATATPPELQSGARNSWPRQLRTFLFPLPRRAFRFLSLGGFPTPACGTTPAACDRDRKIV